MLLLVKRYDLAVLKNIIIIIILLYLPTLLTTTAPSCQPGRNSMRCLGMWYLCRVLCVSHSGGVRDPASLWRGSDHRRQRRCPGTPRPVALHSQPRSRHEEHPIKRLVSTAAAISTFTCCTNASGRWRGVWLWSMYRPNARYRPIGVQKTRKSFSSSTF